MRPVCRNCNGAGRQPIGSIQLCVTCVDRALHAWMETVGKREDKPRDAT
jgi:hypothetical protein